MTVPPPPSPTTTGIRPPSLWSRSPASRSRRASVSLAILVVLVVILSTIGVAVGSVGAVAPRAGGSTAGGSSGIAVARATVSLAEGHGPTAARMWACQGLRMLGTAACGSLPRSPSASVTGWSDAGPNPPPQLVNDFYLVDDVSDGYVLLFGTLSSDYADAASTDMWAFSGLNWTALPPTSPSPSACPGSEIAYDSADGYVLYLGGASFGYAASCPSSNQTWSFHGGAWTQQHPTASPSGLVLASMSDDPADGYVVLFGGETNTGCPPAGYCAETWEYAGGNWTLASPTTSPSARAEAGLAYDANDGYVLLFGGVSAAGSLNDTWNFSAGNWTQLHPVASPPVPQPDAFSYDGADKSVVYTTAQNYSSGANPEITWTYSAGNWTPVTSTPAPVGRMDGQMAEDPHGGVPVFFGGLNEGSQNLDDSWTLHAGHWTNVTAAAPSPRISPAVAYDPATGSVILFGGGTDNFLAPYLADTWSYANGSWTQLNPSRSPDLESDAGMCWDAADGYLLLVGVSPTNQSTVTWEYAGGTWTEVTPTSEPPSPSGEGLVYDGADGYVLLLSGYVGSLQTWTYHAGVWTNRTSTAGAAPPGMTSNPLTYDSTSSEVVLFGSYDLPSHGTSPSIAPYTYTFSSGTWHNATVANATIPPAVYSGATADDPSDGGVLLWGGQLGLDGGITNGTWAFSGGGWSALGATSHPTPRTLSRGADDPAISEDVFFGGQALGGTTPCGSMVTACGDTWLWGSHVSSLPVIESFTASPTSIDLGGTINLTLRAGGGTGPLTYSYLNLPPGCGSTNATSIACTPSAVGDWLVEGRVVDAAGKTASSTVMLAVLSDPSITSFVAVPSTLAIGAETTLETTAVGGTEEYSYAYGTLPSGCLTQDVPALPCAPSAAGNYSITVNVTDGAGPTATRSLALTVTAAGGHGAPTITSLSANPSALVLGNSTNITVVASGVSPLSYAYTGLPPGCSSSNLSALRCTPTSSGTYPLEVTVLDAHHNATRVGTNVTVYPAGGGAGLSVSAFAAAPGIVAVNATTFVEIVASGGDGPLAFVFSGLPPGCQSLNVPILPCTPTATGTFSVYALVSDTTGHHAGVRTTLAVIASGAVAPQVSALVATPSSITLNESLTFVVAVGGGTLPLSYHFDGLPPGCATTDAPVLTCVPTGVGNYTVRVNVTDAAGRTASAGTVVSISRAPVPIVHVGGPNGSTSAISLGWVVDVALGLAGAGLVAAVAFGWDRRERRRDGERLVGQLDAGDGAETTPSQ